MLRIRRLALVTLTTVILASTNVYVATAHQWWNYHWDRSEARLDLTFNNDATSHGDAAEAAIADASRTLFIGSGRSIEGHADVALIIVTDDKYRHVGWLGLANPDELAWSPHCLLWPCHVTHAHARYNAAAAPPGPRPFDSSEIQGIFCEEIGHALGLDHHDGSGDCMNEGAYGQQGFGEHSHGDIARIYGRH